MKKVIKRIVYLGKLCIFVMLQSGNIYAYKFSHNKGLERNESFKNNTSVLLGCSDLQPPFIYFKMLQPRQLQHLIYYLLLTFKMVCNGFSNLFNLIGNIFFTHTKNTNYTIYGKEIFWFWEMEKTLFTFIKTSLQTFLAVPIRRLRSRRNLAWDRKSVV